jgi:hypothetical protein
MFHSLHDSRELRIALAVQISLHTIFVAAAEGCVRLRSSREIKRLGLSG